MGNQGKAVGCFWVDSGGRQEGQDLLEVCLVGVGKEEKGDRNMEMANLNPALWL